MRYITDTQYLQNIANAIRAKKEEIDSAYGIKDLVVSHQPDIVVVPDGITYSTNSTIDYTFNFKKDNNNTGSLKYYPDESLYKIYFTSTKEEIPDTMENKRYYTKLYKAEELNDELTLYEKIVYTKCSKNTTNTYNCLVYRDYDRTIQIDEVKGLDEDSEIKFDELKESNEIEYMFKKDIEGKYYFLSSKTNN